MVILIFHLFQLICNTIFITLLHCISIVNSIQFVICGDIWHKRSLCTDVPPPSEKIGRGDVCTQASINTIQSDISKLLHLRICKISQLQVVLMPNITYNLYKSCYYLFILPTIKFFVIFTSRYLKLRWLNTVLAVCDYVSFAKSWQETGCYSQAETWQVKNILMKDFE